MLTARPPRSLTRAARHWIARRCPVCAVAPGAPVCTGCATDFFAPELARCTRCAARLPGMIAALKFRTRVDLAEVFARLLAARFPADADSVVIALPLPFERERERGFNQSREIARRCARLAGAQPLEGTPLRVRHGAPQQSLQRAARRANVRGAFAVTADVSGRRVLLVDDVMTTGATLDEAAQALKRAGAAHIANRIVARTP
jgi:ComF family protein